MIPSQVCAELRITEEPIAGKLDELWPLLVDHREELTTNKALMELAPDWPRYIAMEEAGLLFSLVAREGPEIVGYSVNFIGQHLHYSRLRFASNDVLFVSKKHRASIGLRLIKATRQAAAAHGAKVMHWHAKPGTPLEAILRRQSCRVQDIMFTEEL
jgi:hypothetical protein